jgi:hypothetical protein
MTDPIVDEVISKFKNRSNVGISKYNTTLKQNNKDNYLYHAQMEAMDFVLYLQKLIDLKAEMTSMAKEYTNDAELGAAIRKFIQS